jgi:hypothetical protein
MRGRGHLRLEVGDGPDGRAPPASDWSQKRRGRSVGPAVGKELGQRRPLRAREEGGRPGSPRGLKEKRKKKGLGRLREKGERRGSEGFSF